MLHQQMLADATNEFIASGAIRRDVHVVLLREQSYMRIYSDYDP